MFTYYGHNCFLFETDSCLFLIDPWFSNKGAFFGSWFQYPANHQYADVVIQAAKHKALVVFITHEHLDHFDLEFISRLDLVRVIIPEYQDKFMIESLVAMGIETLEVPHNTDIDVSCDISIKLLISDVGINHDSAILVRTPAGTFFNQNDCKIFDQLSLISESIDYYSVQFSGATWHPVCFEYSEIEKKNISAKKTQIKLANVCRGIEALNPRYFVPAAGPAVFPFLDYSLSVGRDNIFTHQDVLADHLAFEGHDNVMYLSPGDRPHIDKKTPVPPPTHEYLDSYKKSIVNVWHNLAVEFSEANLKQAIQDRLNLVKDLDFEELPLLIFDWGTSPEEKLTININAGIVSKKCPIDRNFIRLSADKKYFALMHSGYRWQDIYLTMRARVDRRPDVFSNLANVFLFSDVSNIRHAFESSISINPERIIVSDRFGSEFEINRFCPHQGADLSCAEISEKSEVICPRHGWRFDLKAGGINEKSGKSLKAIPSLIQEKRS